jgi:glucosamine-6-phosphate deaminase
VDGQRQLTEPTAARRDEIRRLLALAPEEVIGRAGPRLRVLDDVDALHACLAQEMAQAIARNTVAGQHTCLILPVGPVGQYPLLLELLSTGRTSLRHCHLFFMDEYADEQGRALTPDQPLSFSGQMRRLWLDALPPDLVPPAHQVYFPSERNIDGLAEVVRRLGGIDVCFGGVGIHGHLAFNEPEPGVQRSGPRRVRLNDITVTINALRERVGGNLEGFPRCAFTLGVEQILTARSLRLACRNGIPLDWANTVLRLTLFGQPGEDYPCTFAHGHPDLVVYTDRETLRCPEIML